MIQNIAREISKTSSNNLGKALNDMIESTKMQRRSFERRWYDNNFFDDGFHFRYLDKKTGRIVDRLNQNESNTIRAIPRASKQIRGVANLIMSADPQPVVYPERVSRSEGDEGEIPQDETMRQQYEQQIEQEFKEKQDLVKKVAQRSGQWITEEWSDLDMESKMTHMIILAAKHGVSYMQVWHDNISNSIKTGVFDAFDLYLYGDRNKLEDLPFIIKSVPRSVAEIKADEMFDPRKTATIDPDNKYATSEVKEVYMTGRYGSKQKSDKEATIMLNEGFIKEYLTKETFAKIAKSDTPEVLEGKTEGDMIMRHVFTAGGMTLKDEYMEWTEYPFVDYRFEPGPIYQTPLIERFIPQNKALDIVMSRIEKHINSMTVGIWHKQKGENFIVSNIPGGQLVEYDGRPPGQVNMESIPNHVFNFMGKLDEYMNEQGASTTMGVLPEGVKSGVAIESVKATEYANLKIATKQLEKTLRGIAKKMLYIADEYFIKPKTVYAMNKNEPDYFDIIGNRGYELSQELGVEMPEDVVPLKKSYDVRIEIEPGLGLTMQGKKEAVQQIIEYMRNLSQEGLVTPDAVKLVVEKFLTVYGFGGTAEFMEAMDQLPQEQQLSQEQLGTMKLALLQVLQDTGMLTPPQEELPPEGQPMQEPVQEPIAEGQVM